MKPPLSIIETLVEAVRLGLRNERLIWLLAIISAIPSAIAILLSEYCFAFLQTTNVHTIGVEGLGFYSALLNASLLLMIFIEIITAAMVAAIILGVLKTAMRANWTTVKLSIQYYTWPLVILSILLGLIAFIITIPFGFIIALCSSGGHGPGVAVSKFLMSLMAVLYLIFVKYALADPLIVTEDMEPLAALKKSWQMTRGRFWYVIGCYVVVGTIEYLMLLPFQAYESPHNFNCAKAIDLLISGAFTCYWILLAWCMYWRIRDAENSAVS